MWQTCPEGRAVLRSCGQTARGCSAHLPRTMSRRPSRPGSQPRPRGPGVRSWPVPDQGPWASPTTAAWSQRPPRTGERTSPWFSSLLPAVPHQLPIAHPSTSRPPGALALFCTPSPRNSTASKSSPPSPATSTLGWWHQTRLAGPSLRSRAGGYWEGKGGQSYLSPFQCIPILGRQMGCFK